MARPAHEPTEATRKLVEGMVLVGYPHEEIVNYIGIASVDTLKKHYAKELDAMREKGAALAKTAYQIAMQGNVPMIMFILKTRYGWRETDMNEAANKLINYVIDSKAGKNEWERRDK